jgi:glycosyltransferase involved in cell wall biosynthesis
MGMGIPILMGVRGEAMDLVREGGAGLAVEPEDEDALLEGFARILAGEGGPFAESGREFVSRRFDRDVLAKRYLEVLEAAGKGGRRAAT